MRIKSKTITVLTLAYLYIPFMIWLMTWCRWYIALPCLMLIFVGGYHFLKGSDTDGCVVGIKPVILGIYILLVIGIGIFAGWGGVFEQHYDWFKHGAILSDMIDRSWPVYYSDGTNSAMLTYYIGIYIVPALFGKIFGFAFAEWILVLELITGMILMFLNIFRIIKPQETGKQILTLFGSIAMNYSSLLPLLCILFIPVDNGTASTFGFYIDSPNGAVLSCIYRSLFTNMRAFPAAIYVFLITFLFYENRERIGTYVFMWIPVLLYSTISAIYAAIICGAYFVYVTVKEKRILKSVILNVAASVIALPFIIYLSGNVLSEKPASMGFRLQQISAAPINFLVFFVCDVLFFIVILYRTHKADPYQ